MAVAKNEVLHRGTHLASCNIVLNRRPGTPKQGDMWGSKRGNPNNICVANCSQLLLSIAYRIPCSSARYNGTIDDFM